MGKQVWNAVLAFLHKVISKYPLLKFYFSLFKDRIKRFTFISAIITPLRVLKGNGECFTCSEAAKNHVFISPWTVGLCGNRKVAKDLYFSAFLERQRLVPHTHLHMKSTVLRACTGNPRDRICLPAERSHPWVGLCRELRQTCCILQVQSTHVAVHMQPT